PTVHRMGLRAHGHGNVRGHVLAPRDWSEPGVRAPARGARGLGPTRTGLGPGAAARIPGPYPRPDPLTVSFRDEVDASVSPRCQHEKGVGRTESGPPRSPQSD